MGNQSLDQKPQVIHHGDDRLYSGDGVERGLSATDHHASPSATRCVGARFVRWVDQEESHCSVRLCLSNRHDSNAARGNDVRTVMITDWGLSFWAWNISKDLFRVVKGWDTTINFEHLPLRSLLLPMSPCSYIDFILPFSHTLRDAIILRYLSLYQILPRLSDRRVRQLTARISGDISG